MNNKMINNNKVMRKYLIVPLAFMVSILLTACGPEPGLPAEGGGEDISNEDIVHVSNKMFINESTYPYEDENGEMQEEIERNILDFESDSYGRFIVMYKSPTDSSEMTIPFEYSYHMYNGTISMEYEEEDYIEEYSFTYDSAEMSVTIYSQDGYLMKFDYYKSSDANN